MEYDFETGPEGEVIEREWRRAHERYHGVGQNVVKKFTAVVTPLVRIILALLAALGARSVREALAQRSSEDEHAQAERWARTFYAGAEYEDEPTEQEIAAMRPLVREHRRDLEVQRGNYERSPTWRLAGEIAEAMGMADASAVDILARVKALFAPVNVEPEVDAFVAECRRVSGMSAIDARAIGRPLVEDRARLLRDVEQQRESVRLLRIDKATLREHFETACEKLASVRAGCAEANAIEIAGIVLERDKARAEVARLERKEERLSYVVRRKTDTIDRMAETLRDAGAEIAQLTAQRDDLVSEATAATNQISDMHRELARLKSVPLTEQDPAVTCPVHDPLCIKRCGSGPLTSPEIADPNAPADAAVQAYQPTVEITPATLDIEPPIENPLAADIQRLPAPETRSVTDPEDLLAMDHGAIPLEVRPACDECAATATKTGTTGTFCDAHADACTHAIDAVDVAHDPARVSLPRTTAAIEALPAPEREAYRRGVERGRYEALERPGGWVLVLEDGLRPAERARVAEFCRTVRGVAAALPVAEVTTIRRLARVSVELISARAENERSRRDVDRLTKLARALHRQRKDARERLASQSGYDAADAGGIADAEDDDWLAQRLRAGLDHLRIAADMAQMQTPGGTAHLAVVAKDASGAGRVTATLEAAPFFADLEALLGAENDDAPDSVDPRELPPGSTCRNRLRGLTAQEIAAASWTLKIGDRVRTVDQLTCGAYTDDSVRVRRAGAVGVIVRPLIPPAGDAVAWIVRHDDGTEAPYDTDELLRAARDLPSDSGEPALSIGAERESRLDFERRVMTATSAGAAVGLRRVMTEMGIGQQALAERLCVAVLATNAAGEVLLVRSRKGGDRGWELPGGKCKDGEPAPDAARREFREETGLVVTLDEGEPVMLPPSAQHRGALLFRGRAEGMPRAGGDADMAAWWTAAQVLAAEDLSDLASRDVLLAWAREQTGVQ